MNEAFKDSPFASLHQGVTRGNEAAKRALQIISAANIAHKVEPGEELSLVRLFADVVALLEPSRVEQSDDLDVAGSILLLAVLADKVPQAVLQETFAETSLYLEKLLSRKLDVTAVAKNAVIALGRVLAKQSLTTLHLPGTMRSIQVILVFLMDERAILRVSARMGLVKLVSIPDCPVQVIKAVVATVKQVLATFVPQDPDPVIFVLDAIARGLGVALGRKRAISLLKQILPFSSVDSNATKTAAFKCIRALARASQDEGERQQSFLTQESLYSVAEEMHRAPTPSSAEAALGLVDAYAGVVKSLLVGDRFTALRACGLFVEVALRCTGSVTGADDIRAMVASLKRVLLRLFSDADESEGPVFRSIAAQLNKGLKLRYSHAWPQLFPVYGAFFETGGERQGDVLAGLLREIVELRESPGFSLQAEADACLLGAVRGYKIAALLTHIPLNLHPTRRIPGVPPRPWMLPLLREVRKPSLSYFRKHLGSLADDLETHATAILDKPHTVEGDAIEARKVLQMADQIWELLPIFCQRPTDVDSVGSFATLLGRLLESKPNRRVVVARAIVTIVNLAKTHTPDSGTKVLLSVAPPLLQQLARVFPQVLATTPSRSPLILAAMTAVVSVTPSQTVSKFLVEVMKKLLQLEAGISGGDMADGQGDSRAATREGVSQRALLLDVANAVLGGSSALSEDALSLLWRAVYPLILRKESVLQKKAYLILDRICRISPSFGRRIQPGVFGEVAAGRKVCASAARRARLGLVNALLCAAQEGSDMQMCRLQVQTHFLPEIIVSTKEFNSKTRAAALALVGLLAESLDDQGSRDLLLEMAAGLAGESSFMVSATVTAIAHAVSRCSGPLTGLFQVTVSELCGIVFSLLEQDSRDVAKSVLGFARVAISSLDSDTLRPHLAVLCKGLLLWSQDSKGKIKKGVGFLVQRLLRKFTYEELREHFEDDPAYLAKANKQLNSKKGRKDRDSENDSDDEIIRPPEGNPNFTAMGGGASALGGGDGDLLGAEGARAVMRAETVERKRKESASDLPTDEKGRMIVEVDAGKDGDDDEILMEKGGGGNRQGLKKRGMAAAGGATGKSKDRSERATKPKRRREDSSGEALEPYKYIPLSSKNLSKRRRQQSGKQWRDVVKGKSRKK